ncbi:hypothetical protein HPP92_019692 [Vanilla planifolia]|uniref:Uncharacterized protein n=1 Tax=Vanilla planifolia TaxID=51239 RepID=A0A835Q6Y9_VANPL|nr:hypothetical protein HPP92_019692 [Vanilla planifolia]
MGLTMRGQRDQSSNITTQIYFYNNHFHNIFVPLHIPLTNPRISFINLCIAQPTCPPQQICYQSKISLSLNDKQTDMTNYLFLNHGSPSNISNIRHHPIDEKSIVMCWFYHALYHGHTTCLDYLRHFIVY